MSIVRIFRLGIKVAAWATPHIQEWHRARHFNRTEGQRHLQSRNWAEAEKHLIEALQERHSKKHFIDLNIQLSRAQAKQNRLQPAVESAAAAIQLAQAAGDHAELWRAREALVSLQLAQDDFPAALATLESMQKNQSDPKRLASCLRQRGNVLLKTGRVAEAVSALEESVKLAEKTWGAGHLETAHCLSEIGALCRQTGDHARAQEYLRRALKIYRASSGFDSAQASEGLHNLAMSLEESGDYEGATAEYERVISVRNQQLGGDRAQLADIEVRLAALYIQSGRSSAARELLTHAIGVLESARGERLRDALEIMAVAEDQAGRPQAAELCREKAARLAQPVAS